MQIVPFAPTEFEVDERFVNSEPYDSPFWIASDLDNPEIDFLYGNKSDSISTNAWNYYGSTRYPSPYFYLKLALTPRNVDTYIRIHKDSPYSIPGGMPLIPLFPEKDSWMKDYTAHITAYQH